MTRRTVGPILVSLMAMHVETVLYACPVCFRFEDGPMVAATRSAVFVLVGVTAVVLAACGTFLVRFARRASTLPPPPPPAP